MSTLKRGEVDGRAYGTAQEARRSIGRFIEEIYNRQRLHSALNYLAPADSEVAVMVAPGRKARAANFA